MELGDVDDRDKFTRAPENVITKGEDKDKDECGSPSNQCRHYGRAVTSESLDSSPSLV